MIRELVMAAKWIVVFLIVALANMLLPVWLAVPATVALILGNLWFDWRPS